MSADLSELLERLDAAQAPDRRLDITLAEALEGVEQVDAHLYRVANAEGGWDCGDASAMVEYFTSSLDCALDLAARLGFDSRALLVEALPAVDPGAAVDQLARAVIAAMLGACISRRLERA